MSGEYKAFIAAEDANAVIDEKLKQTFESEFMNIGLKNIPLLECYPSDFDRLLCGGIWCIVGLE